MIDYFPLALERQTWLPENDGQGFHNGDPDDLGGATNLGVTYATWQAWQTQHGHVPSFSAFHVAGKPEMTPIYRAMFWQVVEGDSLGPLSAAVFDAAVVAGPGNAVRCLQTALHVTADGVLGPLTRAIVARMAAGEDLLLTVSGANVRFYDALLAHYQSRSTAWKYLGGWRRRAGQARDLVVGWVAHPPT